MSERIKGLDGLRAIAVLGVYIAHKSVIGNDLGLGAYGVHLFFVLSGFLIVGILHEQRRAIESGTSNFVAEWRTFTLRRAFRIFPVYYVLLAVIGLWGLLTLDQLIQYATYTSNLSFAYYGVPNPKLAGHLWSLAVEEQFYLIAAPLILAIPSGNTRLICWGAILCAVSSSLALRSVGFPFRTLYLGSLSNFGLMGLGGLLAVSPRIMRLPQWIGPSALVLYWAAPFFGTALNKSIPFFSEILLWLTPLLIVAVIAHVVSGQNKFLASALNFTPLRQLGRVSYGFYLFHPFMVFESVFPELPRALLHVMNFGGAIALSALSWVILEAPLQQLGRRLLKRNAPSQSVADERDLVRVAAMPDRRTST